MLNLTREQRHTVGLTFVLDELAPVSPYGRAALKRLKPFTRAGRDALERELDRLACAVRALPAHEDAWLALAHGLSALRDVTRTLQKCAEGVLDAVELFEVKRLLIQLESLCPALRGFAGEIGLTGLSLTDMPQALALLDPEGTRVATFFISDAQSDELRAIRAQKRALERDIARTPAGDERDLLHTRREGLCAREDAEEARVRAGLSAALRPYLPALTDNIETVAYIDLLMQKASLAVKYGCVRARVSDGRLAVEDAWNPQVADTLERQGKRFTPVSIELSTGATVLTGANMGGKSVALRTIALNALLFQLGFFVFAARADMPLFDSLLMASEDRQSVEHGLSTFGGEVYALNEIAARARQGAALLILDEPARGTNPHEGAVIVRAVVGFLNRQSAMSLVATHYDGVAAHAGAHFQIAGLRNVAAHDLRTEIKASGQSGAQVVGRYMDYRIVRADGGGETPRAALDICRILGLDAEILDSIEREMRG